MKYGIKDNITDYIKDYIKDNIKDSIEDDIKDNIKDDIKEDIKDNIKYDIKDNIKSRGYSGTWEHYSMKGASGWSYNLLTVVLQGGALQLSRYQVPCKL